MTETTGTIAGKTFPASPASDGTTNLAFLAGAGGLSEDEIDDILVAVDKSLTDPRPRQRVQIYRPGMDDQTQGPVATVTVAAFGNLLIAVLPKKKGTKYSLDIPRTSYQRDRVKGFLKTVQIPHREEGGNGN